MNRVLSKQVVGTAIKDGKSIVVSAATETTFWTRSDTFAKSVGTSL